MKRTDKYEYLTDGHREKMKALFCSTARGTAEAKDAILDGMTEYVYRRLDAERDRLMLTEEYIDLLGQAGRARGALSAQICERQREALDDLGDKTNLCRDFLCESLFFAGLWEGVATYQALAELIKEWGQHG